VKHALTVLAFNYNLCWLYDFGLSILLGMIFDNNYNQMKKGAGKK